MELSDGFSIAFTNESKIYTHREENRIRSPINPPINLPAREWEVAVSKLIVPHTRKFPVPQIVFEFVLTLYEEPTGGNRITRQENFGFTISLEPWRCNSLDELFCVMNLIFSRSLKYYAKDNAELFKPWKVNPFDIDLRFSYSEKEKRVNIGSVGFPNLPKGIGQTGILIIKDSLRFWVELGFRDQDAPYGYWWLYIPATSHAPPSPKFLTSVLAVYAPDLVVPQQFGDKVRPILDVVPYNFTDNSPFELIQNRTPLYTPIYGGYISNVEIQIEDIDDASIYIEQGKFQIVLHFRPCRDLTKL